MLAAMNVNPLAGLFLLAHACCGQMAGWMKMTLGTEVYLGPGHIVLDGDLVPPSKRGTAALPHFPFPLFGPCLLWPNGRPSQLLLTTCKKIIYTG